MFKQTKNVFTVAFSTALMVSGYPVLAATIPPGYIDPGPPPEDPIGATKALMADTLRDPESAKYRFLGLHPASCKAGWATGKGGWIGWAGKIEINGTNGFGGYTGFTEYTILFQGQAALKAIEGSNFGVWGPSKGLLGIGGGAGVCKYLD